MGLLASPEEYCGNDELKDAAEDKQHAHEHPDVQEGDVRNARNILANLKRIVFIEIRKNVFAYRAKHGG